MLGAESVKFDETEVQKSSNKFVNILKKEMQEYDNYEQHDSSMFLEDFLVKQMEIMPEKFR